MDRGGKRQYKVRTSVIERHVDPPRAKSPLEMTDIMPEGSGFERNNPATQMLAKMLDLPAPS